MKQVTARIPKEMAEKLDQLVASGAFASRADAVREGLFQLIDRQERIGTAQCIIDGYRRRPQIGHEIDWADAATVVMITNEPW